MPDRRTCWIDTGTLPVFEAWVTQISDAGATIILEGNQSLPATFTVYFDAARLVGRTTAIATHNGQEYRVHFTGKARPST